MTLELFCNPYTGLEPDSNLLNVSEKGCPLWHIFFHLFVVFLSLQLLGVLVAFGPFVLLPFHLIPPDAR